MSARRLKIAIYDHSTKARVYTRAVFDAGHVLVPEPPADLLLIDFDAPLPGYQKMLEDFHASGAKIVLYPHGGGQPGLVYDGLWDPDPRVSTNLVLGSGQAEFLRRIEYPAPAYPIGWSFTEFGPFRATDDVRHVVLAPTHPNADGSMSNHHRGGNTRVFEELVKGPWKLTVRHIGTLEDNGLREVDGVQFINGRQVADTSEIDRADVVVAGAGTYPDMAVARGVPTVMYNQASPLLGLPGEEPATLGRPERYLDYLRFPFDAGDGPLDEVLYAAARSEAPIAHWKRRFIGRPFDPRAFVALIERLAAEGAETVTIDATRSFTTLALLDELIEHPALLTEYAAAYGPQDDATLILWGPGLDAQPLLELAEAALAAAGIADDRVPDALLLGLPASPAVDRRLAERANAVLSSWPAAGAIGALPRFGAAVSS